MKVHKATKRLISYAIYDCAQKGKFELSPDHLLLGLYREDFPLIDAVSEHFQLNSFTLLDRLLRQHPDAPFPADESDVFLGADAQLVLNFAQKEAQLFRHQFLRVEHILLGIMNFNQGVFPNFMAKREVAINKVRKVISALRFGGAKVCDSEWVSMGDSTWMEMDFIKDSRFRNEVLDIAILRLFKHYR